MKKIIYVLLILSLSCSTEEKTSLTPNTNSVKVLKYIKDLGFTEYEIQDQPDRYIVQGDIVFSKDMEVPNSISSNVGRTQQRMYSDLVSFTYQNNIRVRIDPTMTASPSMYSEIVGALNDWNLILGMGSRIRFTIATGTTYITDYEIRIIGDNTLTVCGQANYPGVNGGMPGTNVWIDKLELAPLNFNQRKGTIIHELGHAIGFTHTDSSDGTPVPGYEGTDDSSIMQSCCCNIGNVSLSASDKGATVVMYPTEVPYGFDNSGHYPWVFYWNAPLYTGFGSLLGYETKHTRYDYQGIPHVSSTTFQTTTDYTLPFTQGQYPGQSAIVSVRAQFSNGTFSNWVSHNCTL